MTLSLYHCWTCNKSIMDQQDEEFFFWCNKECYDKDDNYHNRRLAPEPEPETSDGPEAPEPITKAERKRRIREALKETNVSKENSDANKTDPNK